ncbi:MAG: T9SS type A sorting domain-containing protein, partial [Flavobacteriales bacterium]
GWSNVFNFTVPTNATTGLVNMRVRISFSAATQGGAPIDPCAAATYGETEDYSINITGSSDLQELNASAVTLFPNPSTGIVHVDLLNSNALLQDLMVYDISGKCMMVPIEKSQQSANVSLDKLAKGIYYVTVSTTLGSVTKQVIKE